MQGTRTSPEDLNRKAKLFAQRDVFLTYYFTTSTVKSTVVNGLAQRIVCLVLLCQSGRQHLKRK